MRMYSETDRRETERERERAGGGGWREKIGARSAIENVLPRTWSDREEKESCVYRCVSM